MRTDNERHDEVEDDDTKTERRICQMADDAEGEDDD